MGRLIKILLVGVASIVGLVMIGAIALFLFFDPNDFRDEISAEVKKATGRDLIIEGDLSLSVFPWIAVNIGRTQLGNAEGFGDQPFLSFEEARLSVKLAPLLFQQTVTVGRVTLDSFSLSLEVAANGDNNWEDLGEAGPDEVVEETAEESAEADDTAGPQALNIAEVRMSDASISFHDAQAGTANVISGLSLRVSRVDAGEPFDIAAEFNFKAEPGGVSGHLQLSNSMVISAGNQHFSIRDFLIDGHLDGVAAGTTEYRFSAPAIDVDMAADRVTMGRMGLSLLGLEMSADVEPYSYSEMRPKMTLMVEPFSAKELMRTVGVEAPPTADPDALTRVSISSRAELGATAVSLTAMTLELDDTKMTGALSVPLTEQGAYQFNLSADSIDVDRYMAPAGSGTSTPASSEEDIEIPVDLIRTLKAKGSLELKRALLSGMTFENMELGVNSANGQLRMHPISAELFDGTYNGDVRINAANDIPSISVNENIKGVQLEPLVKAMFEQDNITGTIEGSFKLSGSGKNLSTIRSDLDGSMAFTLADGTWEGTDLWHKFRSAYALYKQRPPPEPELPPRTEFSNVRVTGPVEDGVFSNDDMLIELPFLRMTGNGTVNLAEGQIDYGMQARVLASPELAGATSESELDDLTGTIIPLSITGPLADPKIRLDVEEMLKAEAKRVVEKEADKLKNRLLGSLIGGSGQTADDEAGGEEDEQTEEEEKPEKKLKNALKKLFDR